MANLLSYMFFSAVNDTLIDCRKWQAIVGRVEWHIRHLSLFMENTDTRDPFYEFYDWFCPWPYFFRVSIPEAIENNHSISDIPKYA